MGWNGLGPGAMNEGIPPPPPGFTMAAEPPPPPPGFTITEPRTTPPAAAGAERRPPQSTVTRAISNLPKSAVQFGHDIVQPVLHPIDTVQSLQNLGKGVLQKLGLRPGSEHVGSADAVGRYLMQRYGSAAAVENTLATDPVGLASDVSMILSGGGTAAARLPGIAGRVGEVTAATGRAIDPLTAAGHAVSGAARVGSEVIGGLGTQTGGRSIRSAYEAGAEGGRAAETFQENLRGTVPMEQVVADARGAVSNIRRERGQVYRDEMAAIGADRTVLNFDRVDNALADVANVKTFHGQVLDPSTQTIRSQIGQAVQEWRQLDPAVFHTAEGLDALKQKIGNIRDGTQINTPERVVADRAYHAVRSTIIDQAPEYSRVMRGYEQASEQIRQIEHELSLGRQGNVNTALRKLQSVLRDNVNTAYGNRATLAEYLVNAGAPHLMEALAGQALNTWIPRGLGRLVGSEALVAGGAALGHGATGAGAATIGALPFMSPRLMGEAAYYAGRVGGAVPAGTGTAVRAAERGSYQLGRGSGSPLAPSDL